jgi:FixJ family two-component response regulator
MRTLLVGLGDGALRARFREISASLGLMPELFDSAELALARVEDPGSAVLLFASGVEGEGLDPRSIKERHPGIAVVALVSLRDWECLSRAEGAGLDDFIVKPFREDEAARTLRRVAGAPR